MSNALRFKHTQVPRHPQELARLKVVDGPDSGAIYVITGDHATIGRGEESDILLTDLRTSRVHALLSMTSQGWVIEDQGSSNGIVFDGQVLRKITLATGQYFTIGETTLEFVPAEEDTVFLMAPTKAPEEIQAKKRQEQLLGNREQIVRAQSSPLLGVPQSDGAQKQAMNPMKLVIYGVVAIGAYLLLFSDDPSPTSRNSKEKSTSQDSKEASNLAAYLPGAGKNESAEKIFKDGIREYFQGNFNRARTQFETVLQISPNHNMAALYLEKCSTSIKDQVKLQLSLAKKSMEAGRLRDARSRFARVMRLLNKDQTDPSYIEANEQFQKVSKEIKQEGVLEP